MLQVTHRGRTLTFEPFEGDVAAALAHGHPYEQEMLQYLEALELPGVYVDAGAHVGTHSLFFARFCPAARIHAFEPVPSWFELLQRNVDHNGVADRVQPHRVALDDGEHALDRLVDGPVSVLKVDVDGAEARVLAGARRILGEHRPLLFLAAATPDHLEACVAQLAPLGYRLTGRVFNNSPTYELACPDSPGAGRMRARTLLPSGWWPQPPSPRLLLRHGAGTLQVDAAVPEEQHAYLTHDDHGLEVVPQESALLAPPGRCFLQLNSSVDGVNAAVFVIQYGLRGRLKSERLSVHPRAFHEIQIDPSARRLRVALRLSGTGRLRLDHLELHAVDHPGRPRALAELAGAETPAGELTAFVPESAPRRAQLLLFDDPELWSRADLLGRADRASWTIRAVHPVIEAGRRFAALVEPEGAADAERSWRNARQVDSVLLLVREDEIARLAGHAELLAEAAEHRGHELDRRRRAAETRVAYLREEIGDLHQMLKEQVHALENARKATSTARRRAERSKQQLRGLQRRLIAARRSVGFRLGRATRAAFTANPLKAPSRWLRAFRGPDEILAEVERELAPSPPKLAAAPKITTSERVALEREVILGWKAPAEGVIVAGGDGGPQPLALIAGPRLAPELAAAAGTRDLAPGIWRHQVDTEPPALLLVCADGLAEGSAWASFGTPGGRDGVAALAGLLDWCRGRRIPTVYWDTLGVPRPRLGLPRGLVVDAVFSVSARACRHAAAQLEVAPEVLLPAIDPNLHHPDRAATTPPHHALFAGAFDRRAGAAEAAALEALLRSLRGHGLRILDDGFAMQGPLAATLALPADLRGLGARRPPAAAEAAAVRAAGLRVVGHPTWRPDFPSWDLLRALALGARVLATPADTGDALISNAVAFAADGAAAARNAERLMREPRLGADWRAAFERIEAAYQLRDRVAVIARHVGAGPLAEPVPAAAAPQRRAEVA